MRLVVVDAVQTSVRRQTILAHTDGWQCLHRNLDYKNKKQPF